MTEEEKDPLDLAYDQGFREGRRRYEYELEYLKGRIIGLEKSNEQILKAMSDAMYRLPMPPTLVPSSQVQHLDGDPTNNDRSNLRIVDRPKP